MDWTKIETLKRDGKKAFLKKDYNKAFECCTEGIELINLGHNSAAGVIYSNISQTELMKKDYLSAIEHAKKSLELDSSFKKSMLRRAMANCELQNCDEAMKDLRYLFEYEPTNSQVISLMKRCSDLPKMKQELRVAYASYCLRKILYKSYKSYETSGFTPSSDYSCLLFTLLRQLFLSLKNSEFVSSLLSGTNVTPYLFEVRISSINWFSVQLMKLKCPCSSSIFALSISMFKILFHLAQPGTFNLMICTVSNEKMFGPWSRYSNIRHVKDNGELILEIDANDLRIIEQNDGMWTRLSYLPEMAKFKNSNFSNLKELVFFSTKPVSMEFLKLWQKKQHWPVKRVLFYDSQPKLENFKRFDGVISNHVTTLCMSFDGIYFDKNVFYKLFNDLAAFKRVFPSLTEVNMALSWKIDIKTFRPFIQTPFKQLILKATAVDHKPEWCSNLRFLIHISLDNATTYDIKKINLEMLKNAIESYRYELDVKNVRFAGPCISECGWSFNSCSLFTIKFETDAAHFVIEFISSS